MSDRIAINQFKVNQTMYIQVQLTGMMCGLEMRRNMVVQSIILKSIQFLERQSD